jgi:hypothetical protein
MAHTLSLDLAATAAFALTADNVSLIGDIRAITNTSAFVSADIDTQFINLSIIGIYRTRSVRDSLGAPVLHIGSVTGVIPHTLPALSSSQ